MPVLERFFRVIRFDTRGHGQSPTFPSPCSFDDLVADAFSVLDAHGVQKASVMGLSLGGMTALGMGLARPDRIERVVCCAARADAPPPFIQTWHDRLAKLDEGGVEAVWQSTVGMWLSDKTRAAHPGRETALREGFLSTTVEGYRGCANALMNLDYLRRLGNMTVPTFFIAGEHDLAASPDTMRTMAKATPDAKFATVPGAKHIINADNPECFVVSLMGFLELEEGTAAV